MGRLSVRCFIGLGTYLSACHHVCSHWNQGGNKQSINIVKIHYPKKYPLECHCPYGVQSYHTTSIKRSIDRVYELDDQKGNHRQKVSTPTLNGTPERHPREFTLPKIHWKQFTQECHRPYSQPNVFNG